MLSKKQIRLAAALVLALTMPAPLSAQDGQDAVLAAKTAGSAAAVLTGHRLGLGLERSAGVRDGQWTGRRAAALLDDVLRITAG